MLQFFSLACLATLWIDISNGGFIPAAYDRSKAERLSPQDKIVGDDSVSIRDYPYQLAFIRTTESSLVYVCGASVISANWALSAAHCAIGPVTKVYLRANSTSWIFGGTRYNVSQMIVHPGYMYPNDHDLALIRVATPFVFGDGVGLIALPCGDQVTTPGANATATGWGRTEWNGNMSPTLQMVTLSIVSMNDCKAVWGSYISSTVICAMAQETDSHQSICQGDSGGPLVVNQQLIGVSSFTTDNGCGLIGMPDGFAQVSMMRDWISENSDIAYCSSNQGGNLPTQALLFVSLCLALHLNNLPGITLN